MKTRLHSFAGLFSAGLTLALLITPSVRLRANDDLGDHRDGRERLSVYPPNSRPFGLSYAEWSVVWWRWLLALPLSENPLFDLDGADAATGQSGPVWFLVGSAVGPVERKITVPKGKALFFPIINVVNDFPCPDPNFQPQPGQSLEDFLTEGAQGYMDQVTELRLMVDGVRLRHPFRYRATSRLFEFTADPSLQVWDPCIQGQPQPGVSDGYWVMLKPLDVGRHIVRFLGAGPWTQEVTYHITVTRSRH